MFISPITSQYGWLARHERALFVILLVSSFLVKLLFIPIPGYKVDQNSFLYWYNYASGGNFSNFYEPPNWSDYPPFNVYIFWLFGNLFVKPAYLLQSTFSTFNFSPELAASLAVKLPPVVFDLALTSLLYFFLRRRFSSQASLAVAFAHAFNPAVIYDLAVWGQMDSIYSLFAAASLILLLSKKYELSSLLLSLSLLTKPQSIILLPFLIYSLARDRAWRRFISCALLSSFAIFLIVLPFSQGNPLNFLLNLYRKAYNIYPYTTINAYNFWSIAGGAGKFWQPDNKEILAISLRSWGIILFLLFSIPVLWQFHRRFSEGSLIFSSFLLSFGFFFFMTRMHERYIFLALPLLSLSLPYFPRLSWIYAGLSFTFFGSLAYILPILNSDKFVPDGDFSFFILVPAYLLLLSWSTWTFLRKKVASDTRKYENMHFEV